MAPKRPRKVMNAKQPSAEKRGPKEKVDDDVFEIDYILDKRESDDGVEYYIKWKNFPSSSNTWEPEANLKESSIKEYEQRLAKEDTKKKEVEPKAESPKPKRAKPARAKKDDQTDKGKTENQVVKKGKTDDVEQEQVAEAPEKSDKKERRSTRTPRTSKAAPVKVIATKIKFPSLETKKAPARRGPKKAASPIVNGQVGGIEEEKEEEEEEEIASPPLEGLEDEDAEIPTEIDLSDIKSLRCINEASRGKTITLLGKYEGEDIVIRLEKTVFSEDHVKQALAGSDTQSKRDFVNDIYSRYTVTPTNSLNDLNATLIWPATEAVKAKYSKVESVLFCETSETYVKIIEPVIERIIKGDDDPNRWVYNILDGVSEKERVILDDQDPNSGFIMVPDLKWSGELKDLNVTAICRRRDIRSLRDLTDKHLVLLNNILTKGSKAIKDHYQIDDSDIRIYVHYHPSFYHFHVHFKRVDPSDYEATDRDHLLGTVINNITMKKDYYKKSSLIYPLSRSRLIYQELKKAKRI